MAVKQLGKAASGQTDLTTRADVAGIVPGYLFGLRLSNDATTPNTVIDIWPGVATSDDGTTSIKLPSTWTKTTGAWAAGTGNGGLDTGAVAASTWYHVFLISGSSGVDILLSKSATAPAMPSGFTLKRRLGSIKTNNSSNINAFNQTGDRFDWVTPVLELNGAFGQTTAVIQSLSGVPTGVAVQAILCGDVWDNTTLCPVLLISSLGQADNAPSGTNATAIPPSTASGTYSAYGITVVSNTSGQARFRVSSTTMNLQCSTSGYIDTRGR